ncbi:hypothetical protein ACN27G_08665 [Plantactinospora sp. WMMB334]|uniref:hypothetical protein n=1 Tax=Plantactinospora sp. WMMB334 TaxID=3404119 RepID=UPI003B944645
MSLEELTHEEPFYAAVRLLAETAWRRRMTVEALLALTDLLDPLDDPDAGRGDANATGSPIPD